MQMKMHYVWLAGLVTLGMSCTKLVQVPEPVNTITTTETFSTDANSTSAVVGIYYNMTNGVNGNGLDWSNGLTTFCAGQSADEMLIYSNGDPNVAQFQNNTLNSLNNYLGTFWDNPYFEIYEANAAIAGLQASSTVTPSVKTELMGESYFTRAYCYFYLVNLFGNIPLVTTTEWAQTADLPNATPTQIYQQMVSDLGVAESTLPADFSVGNGQRIRPNKWAAAALLARVYLFEGNWMGADSAASAVLGSSLFKLTGLDSVFLANSLEAIWQLQPAGGSNYATYEANNNLPQPLNSGYPNYILTTQLQNAFDSGDLRAVDWLDSTNYGGTYVYYPFKYKVQSASVSDIPEFYMMLRLGEQYLIRAEAEAHGADLNVIRARAGLPAYAGATDSSSVLTAIQHERRVELFCEQGMRWFDLKRWGIAANALDTIAGKPNPWNPDQLLYPIPIGEIKADPKLQQNLGY
jgi:hypothetical protein